jgi:hypothetical protein
MRTILLTRQEIIINIWPNRDDSDHVLIITIDVGVGDGRMSRMGCVSHYAKSQGARFVSRGKKVGIYNDADSTFSESDFHKAAAPV